MRYVITVQGSRVTSGYMLAAAGEREGEREKGAARQTETDRQRQRETETETERGRGRHPHTQKVGAGGREGGLVSLEEQSLQVHSCR